MLVTVSGRCSPVTSGYEISRQYVAFLGVLFTFLVGVSPFSSKCRLQACLAYPLGGYRIRCLQRPLTL